MKLCCGRFGFGEFRCGLLLDKNMLRSTACKWLGQLKTWCKVSSTEWRLAFKTQLATVQFYCTCLTSSSRNTQTLQRGWAGHPRCRLIDCGLTDALRHQLATPCQVEVNGGPHFICFLARNLMTPQCGVHRNPLAPLRPPL